jgi:hypothetical protein
VAAVGDSALINTEAHEPLTDPKTWERCQREPGVQRRAHSRFLLVGARALRSLRYALSGFSYGGGNGRNVPVYRCKGNRRGCSEPSVITAKLLEDHVRTTVVDRLHGLDLEAASNGFDFAALDQDYTDALAELKTFVGDVSARRTMGEALWQAELTARAADRDQKREARDRAYAQSHLIAVSRDVDDLDQDDLRSLIAGMIRHVFVRRRP